MELLEALGQIPLVYVEMARVYFHLALGVAILGILFEEVTR